MNNFKKKEYKISDIVSTVSHQLKTPLSIIKGCLEILSSKDLGELNKKQKECLNDALENTERMNSLIKNLLNISKIEEDELEIKPELSDLKEIIKKIINNFYALSKAKNCTISFKVLNKVPLMLFDPLKIEQVVINIISNAIFYNKGEGFIEVFLEKKDNELLFSCKDNGLGVANDEKEKIFKKFYRSEKTIFLNVSGSGLGLFISKAIVEKSNGKIWFESEENKGTTFYFSLPIIKK